MSVLHKEDNWAQIDLAKDPKQLWDAIAKSHFDQVESNICKQFMQALFCVLSCEQLSGEELFQYKKRFDQIVDRLHVALKMVRDSGLSYLCCPFHLRVTGVRLLRLTILLSNCRMSQLK